jgi:hypothetical protein
MENHNLLSGRSYFSARTVFRFYFPNTEPWKNGKMENCNLLSGRSYFSARTVFGFFFSVVRKMAENPVGFLPHPLCPWPSLSLTLTEIYENYSKKSVWQGFSNDLFSFKLFTSLIDKY